MARIELLLQRAQVHVRGACPAVALPLEVGLNHTDAKRDLEGQAEMRQEGE